MTRLVLGPRENKEREIEITLAARTPQNRAMGYICQCSYNYRYIFAFSKSSINFSIEPYCPATVPLESTTNMVGTFATP